jgi:hypothetical protein
LLAVALCALLVDLQNRNQNEVPKFNIYAVPLLRVAVVKAVVAMGKFIDGHAHEPSWKAAIEFARQEFIRYVGPLRIWRSLLFRRDLGGISSRQRSR